MFTEFYNPIWWTIVAINFASSAILLTFVLRWRFLLLKPSIIFLAYYQLSVMWPAVWWMDYLRSYVGDTYAYVWALHGFGLVATLVSVLTWHRTAQHIRHRIMASSAVAPKSKVDELTICAVLFGFVALWYLSTVGWSNTGLAAIVSDNENASQVREASFKLISSAALRYAWAFMSCSISYILGYLLAVECIRDLRRPNYLRALFAGISYLAVLAVVMLPGARAPAAMVALTTLYSYYVSTGFKLNPLKFGAVAAAALLLPSMLSLLREQQPVTLANVWLYYFDIVDRVAGRSIEDNIWMVSYVQNEGFFGHAGFPAVAKLMGEESVNIFNIVGLHFRPDGIQSVSANCAFPTVNYACYGSGSIVLSVILTFCMDGMLFLTTGLPRRLLVPCCGICAIISMNFAMTLYTTVFLTHGLMITVIVCYLIHIVGKILRSRPTPPAAPASPGV